MAKSNTQKVKDSKARRVARGERLIQVWVPAADEAAIAEIRERAERACDESLKHQSETTE